MAWVKKLLLSLSIYMYIYIYWPQTIKYCSSSITIISDFVATVPLRCLYANDLQ